MIGIPGKIVMVTRLSAALWLSFLMSVPAMAEPRIEFLGASTASMSNPHDLKLSPDGRYLLVSDVGNNRVLFLDPETLAPLGHFGSDHQDGTHDVDFDAAGRLYVADTHNNRVMIYDLNGTEGIQVGELSDRIRGPEGILIHSNGRIYVGGVWSNNVVAYREGKVVSELTGLSSPHDLELAPDGTLWLADSGNNRLLQLTSDLTIIRELSGPPYEFNGVRYLDVLPDGTLIAADKNSHRVLIIASGGELRATIGSGFPGKGPMLFRTPEGVETRGDIVWLSDSGNDRIVKYRISLD
jgi:tripartite motif-containing protein 71